MKRFLSFFLVITLLVVGLPLLALQKKPAFSSQTPAAEKRLSLSKQKRGTLPDFKVYLSQEKKVVTVSAHDYVKGVLFGEMPLEYHEEALKAQAVAAYTYALYVKEQQAKKVNKDFEGADITDDPTYHQNYLTEKSQKEKYKNNYTQMSKKADQILDEVLGWRILYKNQPALSVVHCVSPGQTEDGALCWGGNYPYLKSVPSPGDTQSSEYQTSKTVSEEEFKKAVSGLQGVQLGKDAAQWVGKAERTPSGTVLKLEVGGTVLTGAQIRSLFSLKSAFFTIEYHASKGFRFQVKGHGHGVGMSQYGANIMAKQDAAWQEILRHYYTGITLASPTESSSTQQ